MILVLTLGCSHRYQFTDRISPETKAWVAKIAEVNRFEGPVIGEGARGSTQYINFTELKKVATRAELIALTDHPNGPVRCYAVSALSDDTTFAMKDLLSIVCRHISDDQKVYTKSFCIVGDRYAGDLFIEAMNRRGIDDELSGNRDSAYEYLDSLLIYTPNKLYARQNAIGRGKLTAHFYNRVRTLVLEEDDAQALVALAAFRKTQDIPLILKERYKGIKYLAISEFPDPAFRPLLRQSLEDEMSRPTQFAPLCMAIAAFRDDTAFQMLKVLLARETSPYVHGDHVDAVFKAINKHYSPVYDELLWDMWEHDRRITPEVFTHLYEQHPQKAYELTQKTISNCKGLYAVNYIENSRDGYAFRRLVGDMLDTMLVHDRALALEEINKNILTTDINLFSPFAESVVKSKDTSGIRALLTRIDKEWDPAIYRKAGDVIKEALRMLANENAGFHH